MRTEKKIAIIIAATMVVAGSIIAVVSFNSTRTRKTQAINENFEDIDLKILNQDMVIKKTDESNAYLSYYESNKSKYDVSVSGETLKIEEKKDKTFLNIDYIYGFKYPVELYLPKEEYKNIKADFASGDIHIEDSFTFCDVDLNIGSGDIYLSDLTMEELAAEINSGELILANVNAKQDFKAQTGSGDIKLKSCDGQNMELTATDGSVTGVLKTAKSFNAQASSGDVKLPENGNGGNCYIRTGSGDINISIEE